ncbi:MAG: hypothetical protein IBJ03_05915 [Gemmatimonadaceae bacterium]|nr:hypothetical protein [Gemmatimonadaceae bacterium]
MSALALIATTPADLIGQTCDGKTVSRVEVVRSARHVLDRARVPGPLRAIVRPLLVGAPSRSNSITPWLLLRESTRCTEQRRAESERLLRTLPYIADATVSVVDEGSTVAIVVETVDDLRPIIGLGVRGSSVQSAELGSTSIDGSGQLASVRWQNGGAYRDGFGARYTHYHPFGGTNLAQMAIAQTPLGSNTLLGLSRPFASSVQRMAAFAGYARDEGYATFSRDAGDPLSVSSLRERADIGFATRVTASSRETWLLGGVAGWERRVFGGEAVHLSDSGRVAVQSEDLSNRFGGGEALRVGVVGGIRALSFVKARAFDGLEATQDVARGMQMLLTVGRSVSGDDVGPYVRGDVFAGVGTAESYLGLQLRADARRVGSDFRESVLSGRLAWYARPSERQTRVWAAEYAGASTAHQPYQLGIADEATGIRGYRGARIGGGRRLVLRAERRFLMPSAGDQLAWGVAGFADAGQLWAGGVPFGVNAFRSGAGVSLLAAVPRTSRSVAKVEIAYPLVPDRHAKGLDVRVSYRIASRLFWREPDGISRARAAMPTTDVFVWP